MVSINGHIEGQRLHSRNLIMSLLESERHLSRASLERRANLSRTTVSHIVKELVQAGLVHEVSNPLDDSSELSAGRGRPTKLLAVDAKVWFAMGAELQPAKWIVALINSSGRVVSRTELPLPNKDPMTALGILCDGFSRLKHNVPGKLLPAIGIGNPGVVDVEAGTVKWSADPVRLNVAVREAIEAELGMPAYVINRHCASGLAEARFGAGAGIRELAYVGIGTGISAALFSKGRLLEGANYSAGQIGHTTVVPDGPLCPCGNTGCLQTMATSRAILQEAHRLAERRSDASDHVRQYMSDLTGEALCLAAKQGDSVAHAALQHAAKYLGIAIANLINLINPNVVVLGGPIGRSGEPLLGLVRAEVKRRAMSHPLSVATILPGMLGIDAGAIGAASLVLDRKVELTLGKIDD